MKILNNPWVRYTLTLVVGVTVGAIFYPTKNIEREIESKYQRQVETLKEERNYIQEKYSAELNREIKSNIEYRKQTEQKISSLRTENTRLQSQMKKRKLKIVKPDGTIVEETFEESQTEVVSQVVTSIKQEYSQKVQSIENKWKRVHERRIRDIKASYEKKIAEKENVISSLKKKEEIEINPRSFSIGVGALTDGNYYGNASYDIFGPVFINGHFDTNKEFNDNRAGIGFGLRF